MGTAVTIHSYLRGHGFHPLPLNTSAHINLAGAELWYYIEVPVEEAKEAKQLLIDIGHEANPIK